MSVDCHQLRSGRWADGSRTRAAGSSRRRSSSTASAGFEQTTVAEIAERAGLTERTFFRHFADKREVLFAGAEALQELLVSAVAGAPDSAAPIEAVAARPRGRRRDLPGAPRVLRGSARPIIAANAELQERELIKLASLASALAEALRRRGVGDPAASLAPRQGSPSSRSPLRSGFTTPAGGPCARASGHR